MKIAKLNELHLKSKYEKYLASIIRIQKMFRGYKLRFTLSSWLEIRKDELRIRKLDDIIRSKLSYKIFKFMNMANTLPSDSAKEYILSLFPWYMEDAISDCIEKKWTMAATMTGWKKGRQMFSYTSAIRALGVLISKKRKYQNMKKEVIKKTNIQQKAHQDYIRVIFSSIHKYN